jgi:putative FmdB family regulatory protein
MSRYEFFCNACQKPFSKMPIAEEYEEGRTICPNCGSEDVEQRPTAFYPINYRESA